MLSSSLTAAHNHLLAKRKCSSEIVGFPAKSLLFSVLTKAAPHACVGDSCQDNVKMCYSALANEILQIEVYKHNLLNEVPEIAGQLPHIAVGQVHTL